MNLQQRLVAVAIVFTSGVLGADGQCVGLTTDEKVAFLEVSRKYFKALPGGYGANGGRCKEQPTGLVDRSEAADYAAMTNAHFSALLRRGEQVRRLKSY